ncbi:unnamed protein product (macronuclear) [Paramecium tetraurelia]|uniref:Uncharacterized protein n=1 Tax=Paramecium tetraurelia TaxID=5888 RepID=A0CIM0_PARTE|nr:uncharacterized protein GSPATT00007772001 [Paramecium tetraurelia]CAK70637.1 unnamed protein product [Paramecium tetraurelia]
MDKDLLGFSLSNESKEEAYQIKLFLNSSPQSNY